MPKTQVATKETLDIEELTPHQLRSLQTPEDLLAFYQMQGITAGDITEYGDGFPVLLGDDKKVLVGRPFHLIGWKKFESKKYGVDGVMVWIMCASVNTQTGEYERYRLVDLSTGIAKQLINDIAVNRPLNVPGGLIRSEYNDAGPNGDLHGVTYYLDTSASAA